MAGQGGAGGTLPNGAYCTADTSCASGYCVGASCSRKVCRSDADCAAGVKCGQGAPPWDFCSSTLPYGSCACGY